MAIRSHPGVQKMPASGISSELSAHQMAPAGAIAHSSLISALVLRPFRFLPRLAAHGQVYVSFDASLVTC